MKMDICINFPFTIMLLLWMNQRVLGVNVTVGVDNTNTCVGNNITLTCAINPFTTPPSATWNRNGSVLTTCVATGACTTDSLLIGGVQYSFFGSSTGIQVSLQIQLVENGIKWICDYNAINYEYTFAVPNECRSVAKTNKPAYLNAVSLCGFSVCKGWFCFMIAKLSSCLVFIYSVAKQWYFSTRYIIKGKVFYGIELVIIAAVNQVVSSITTGVVLGLFAEQIAISLIIIVSLLILVWPALAVVIYFVLKARFCQDEWTYTKFEDDLKQSSLSNDAHIKFDTINKDKIWFKVRAMDDVLMTLCGKKNQPFLNIIMGHDKPLRKSYSKSPIPTVACNNVLRTADKYRIFYLTCQVDKVTVIKVVNGIEDIVLEWSDANGYGQLEISDIVMSNYMAVPKDVDESVSTADTHTLTGSRGEWTFFFRKGDGLYGNEDDMSPDGLHWIEDDTCLSKTVQLFLVVLFPIAWLVLLILSLRNCIMFIAKKIKNRQDTDGKELALPLVSCCQNSIRPNATENGQPNDGMITTENVWINTPIGRKMPDLPAIKMTKQTAAVTEDKKQKKKKKKSKNQNKDSSRNDIQQSQEDTENNTVKTVAY